MNTPPVSERFFEYKKSFRDLEERIGKEFISIPSNEWKDYYEEIEGDEKINQCSFGISCMCKHRTQTDRGSRFKRSHPESGKR